MKKCIIWTVMIFKYMKKNAVECRKWLPQFKKNPGGGHAPGTP